jgi:hypothetical protein
MNQGLLIAIIVGVFIVIAALGFLVVRTRRTRRLRARFGPEYDRVVSEAGGVRQAEGVLEFREKRREQFAIRPLSPSDRATYKAKWDEVQSKFVDDPRQSVGVADRLVNEVMRARGYPMSDFDQRAADISVDHPIVVENYRAAHTIALRHDRGHADTEDLRRAMVHYRALFEELLDDRHLSKKGA